METLLVNDREASRLLGISRSKFHLLVADGRIPRLKLGRAARYRRADIVDFAQNLAAGTDAPVVVAGAHVGPEGPHMIGCVTDPRGDDLRNTWGLERLDGRL